jgi:hypothetical protein
MNAVNRLTVALASWPQHTFRFNRTNRVRPVQRRAQHAQRWRCVSTTLRHMRREFIEFYSLCWAVC